MIGKYRGRAPARVALIISLVINLGVLAFFKYINFFVGNVNALFGLSLPQTGIAMPIGISFFTFQTLSYAIDIYRGEVRTQRSFLDFLLFVSLFPQLIAGPILRYSEIAAQLRDRSSTMEDTAYGITRFICGLAKKVLLANYCCTVADKLLAAQSLGSLSVVGAWLGVVMYAFQIYFDFSGYSDMAIGLGRIFGFKYSENFNHPYIARNITDFWRRWHISLSSWFRDYVYIPLGGNRCGRARQLFNMLVVWTLTGFWHGASWNFVIWGLWFFLLLMVEKLMGRRALQRIPRIIGIPVTFVLVCVGWIFFYFTDLSNATVTLQTFFGLGGREFIDDTARLALFNSLPLLLVCIVGSTPLFAAVGQAIEYNAHNRRISAATYGLPSLVYNTVLLALCVVSLVCSTTNPFIYFRF